MQYVFPRVWLTRIFLTSAATVICFSGCTAYVAGPAATVYVAPDNYVYYPSYGVYYSSGMHQFAYMDGGVWVQRPYYNGVSVNVLLASPSVRMDFHDSPANHAAEMSRRYPSNWHPSGGPGGPGPGQFHQPPPGSGPHPQPQKAPLPRRPAPAHPAHEDK